MDNGKVRAHLRKGELAVNLLVGLGFTYEEKANALPKWVAPATFVNMEDARTEMQAVIDKFAPKKEAEPVKAAQPTPRECPVSVGKQFTILTLPAGHFLHGYRMPPFHEWTVTETTFVEPGSERSIRLNGFTGWAIGFDLVSGFSKRGLWLPLSCIKVKRDAHF